MQLRPSQTLARLFRDKIESGQWPVGSRLPTTRELSSQFQVSVNTIQSAFRYLEADDLVDRRPRRGGFVKAVPERRGPGVRTRTTVAIIAEAVSKDATREGHNWCHAIARAAEREFARANYHVSLLSWEIDDPEAAGRLRARIDEIQDHLSGVVCFPMPGVTPMVEQLQARGIACVTINRPSPQAVQNFVTADNLEGGRLVGRCFGGLGYERVVVLGEQFTPGNTTADKYAGFLQGYLESGRSSRNVEFLASKSFHDADGYERLRAYADEFGPPRGVFATGDFLALGALRLCRDRGWSVPGDVGIVGGTGLDVARYSYPALSVLEQPMDGMGAEAARMLVEMISGGTKEMPGRFIPSPLVVRQSLDVPDGVLKDLGTAGKADLVRVERGSPVTGSKD
jgi:DNA-binding LacI/PurR family transcriptional regulator